MMKPKVDAEFAALIPPLSSEELAGLEASIAAEGCRDALVLWDGTLIDGHNRHAICTRTGKPFKTIAREFSDRAAAMAGIIDNQSGRRNLSDLDKIGLERKREIIVARKAKANLKTSSGGSNPRPLAKAPKAEPINTRRECARRAGVGEKTYDAGKLILEAAEAGGGDKKSAAARKSGWAKAPNPINSAAKDRKTVVGHFDPRPNSVHRTREAIAKDTQTSPSTVKRAMTMRKNRPDLSAKVARGDKLAELERLRAGRWTGGWTTATLHLPRCGKCGGKKLRTQHTARYPDATIRHTVCQTCGQHVRVFVT